MGQTSIGNFFFFFLDKYSIWIICHLCHLSVSSCSMLIFLVRQKYLSAQLFLPFYNFMVNNHKNLWNQKYKGTTKKREKREKNNSNRIIHVQAVINLLVPLDKLHIIEMHRKCIIQLHTRQTNLISKSITTSFSWAGGRLSTTSVVTKRQVFTSENPTVPIISLKQSNHKT